MLGKKKSELTPSTGQKKLGVGASTSTHGAKSTPTHQVKQKAQQSSISDMNQKKKLGVKPEIHKPKIAKLPTIRRKEEMQEISSERKAQKLAAAIAARKAEWKKAGKEFVKLDDLLKNVKTLPKTGSSTTAVRETPSSNSPAETCAVSPAPTSLPAESADVSAASSGEAPSAEPAPAPAAPPPKESRPVPIKSSPYLRR